MNFNLLQKQQFNKQQKNTCDLIRNKIVDKIIDVSKASQQINSQTVVNELHKEILQVRQISSEETQKLINDSRLIFQYNNRILKTKITQYID